MKLMFASDIHGSAKYCRRMLDAFAAEQAEQLILLGDLLYHGPRNDLPEEYAPKAVLSMLNEYADQLLCVRGNCDTEVDQMVLKFPILAEYAVLYLDGVRVYLTHGHHFSEQQPLNMRKGDILCGGHTHVPACVRHDTFLYLNPGSVSIPKENSAHSYMIYENGIFQWTNLEDDHMYLSYDRKDLL